MSQTQLQAILPNLARVGTLVKDRSYRQVWRFEISGRGYYLKFYPRRDSRLKRLLRGSPAWREFDRLRWLQKARVPSPRATHFLAGLRLGDQVGDAVILEAIEPSVTLDEHLSQAELRGEPVAEHRELSRQVRELVHQLGTAGLGHSDLHLGNFLLHDKRLFLLDGYAVRRGGLRQKDVMLLAHSAARYATHGDVRRAWDLLGGGGELPRDNPVSRKLVRKFLSRIMGENRYFGRLRLGAWSGFFVRRCKYPYRWSGASRLTISEEDWQSAWPQLLAQIESDQFEILKRTRSGDVLAGEIVLGGRPLSVIVKRPRRKYWYRYLNEIGRGCRARRAWKKAWALIARDIPTAWPLLMMEKRVLGYVTDAIIVFEKVPGLTLANVQLDELLPRDRDALFRRTGRLLRQLEERGLYHWDAKASNWIARPDEKLGPTPILVDVDGIRSRWGVARGMERLLRSMREHPQYTPQDSLALCQGYAPFAPLHREPAEPPAASQTEGEAESDAG